MKPKLKRLKLTLNNYKTPERIIMARKQITLTLLPETDEKLTRIAKSRLVSKGIIVDEVIAKKKEILGSEDK